MKWLKKISMTPLDSIAKVIDNLSQQTNDRTNAPSIRVVREAIQENWLTVYPVGSVYININDVNPSELFGGTWQQIKDRFLLACGDTYNNGATGGAASRSYTPAGTVGEHVLTVDEMPSHGHQLNGIKGSIKGTVSGAETDSILVDTQIQGTNLVGGGEGHNHTFTGTAATINTMPPYLAVNVWVRTA